MTSRLLPFLIVCMIWAAGCHKEPEVAKQTPGAEADKPRTQTSFYEHFDPAQFKDKYGSKFSFVQAATSQSGIAFDSGDICKAFEIAGKISKVNFKKLIESAQADLLQLAKSNAVTVSSEENSDIKNQPQWLLGWYFTNTKRDTVQGSRFTYNQGPIQGAVEVLWHPMDDDEPRWRLVIVLHERKFAKGS